MYSSNLVAYVLDRTDLLNRSVGSSCFMSDTLVKRHLKH